MIKKQFCFHLMLACFDSSEFDEFFQMLEYNSQLIGFRFLLATNYSLSPAPLSSAFLHVLSASNDDTRLNFVLIFIRL